MAPAATACQPAATDRADAVLAARLLAGDDAALTEAFDRYAGLVRTAARRVLGDRAAADDVVQEVFVALWRRPDHYRPDRGALAAYLTVVGHRRALDTVRSELRRAGRDRHADRLVPPPRGRPDEAERSLVAELVRTAVGRLPDDQRRVVELAYFAGLSHSAVANALGIPPGTAKSRLRLGLSKLEASLDRSLLEEP